MLSKKNRWDNSCRSSCKTKVSRKSAKVPWKICRYWSIKLESVLSACTGTKRDPGYSKSYAVYWTGVAVESFRHFILALIGAFMLMPSARQLETCLGSLPNGPGKSPRAQDFLTTRKRQCFWPRCTCRFWRVWTTHIASNDVYNALCEAVRSRRSVAFTTRCFRNVYQNSSAGNWERILASNDRPVWATKGNGCVRVAGKFKRKHYQRWRQQQPESFKRAATT